MANPQLFNYIVLVSNKTLSVVTSLMIILLSFNDCFLQRNVNFLMTPTVYPWPTLPASSVVIYSQLSACPGEIKPSNDHMST